MSTAEPTTVAPPPLTDTLPEVLGHLMRWRGIDRQTAMDRLGISQTTWYAHLKDSKWSAIQMAELADLLEVDVAVLYGTVDELFRSR